MSSTKENKPFVSREEGGKARRGKKGAKDESFIPHETVQEEVKATPKAEEPVEVEVVPDDPAEDEKRKKLEIAKLGVADRAIAQLKAKYETLAIKGVDDREGYKVAKQAWQEVRSVRTGLEKRGVAIRSKISEISKAVGKEEDRLVNLISPLEERLQKLWKDVDKEKDRVQKAKEKEEQDRLINRINELMALGMELRDGFYRIGETISMDVATLRALPDEQYNKLKGAVESKAAELAELKRQKDEEEQKERDRVKAEQDKLKEDQDKLDEEKRQLMAERREVRLGKLENLGMVVLDEKPEVIAYGSLRLYTAPLLEMDMATFNQTVDTTRAEIESRKAAQVRSKQLEEIGMKRTGNDLLYDNGFRTISHTLSHFLQLDDYGYQEHLRLLKEMIQEADQAKLDHEKNQAEEKRLLEIKEKYIAKCMDIAGLSYGYNEKLFFFKNDQGTVAITWNDLLPLTDDKITEMAQELGNQVLELKRKSDQAKKDKDEKDKKENEAKMGDTQRWEIMVTNAIAAAPEPTSFKTKAYQLKAQAYLDWLNNSLK
jgi:hypothetical protein